MLSTFPFPLKPHLELLAHCYYPVLRQLMEPKCKEEDVIHSSNVRHWPCGQVFLFPEGFTEK